MNNANTSDPSGARDHARSMAGLKAEAMPMVPATAAIDLPPGVAAGLVVWEETIAGGGYAGRQLARGSRLRLTDLKGDACVSLLIFNAERPVERLNIADTLKVQWNGYLEAGRLLLSDMGRVLASIVADTVGWHDTVCGASDAALVAQKYGPSSYQKARNEFHRNARDCFLIELAKWGLGPRDLVPNLNLFSKVVADEAGRLTFVPDQAPAGSRIELRFEMNTLVVLNTCQHPLDPDPSYHPRPVRLEVFDGPPPAADDPCRRSRPENERAFLNTENYCALRAPSSIP